MYPTPERISELNRTQGISEAGLSRHTCFLIRTGSRRKERLWVLDALKENHIPRTTFSDEAERPAILFSLAWYFLCRAGQASVRQARTYLQSGWYHICKFFLRRRMK